MIGIGIGVGIGRNRFGTGSTPVGLLLDTYSGAAAAYSLRKLSNTYSGSAIQVRRSSDDDILDVGFVGGELDTTSLETFVNAQDVKPADYGEGAAAAYSLRYVSASYGGFVIGARRDDNETLDFTPTQITDGTLATWSQGGNVYVHTWYDQSGNGHNASQSASASQPQIVSSGSVILENGKPALSFDGGNDWFEFNSFNSNAGDLQISIFATLKSDFSKLSQQSQLITTNNSTYGNILRTGVGTDGVFITVASGDQISGTMTSNQSVVGIFVTNSSTYNSVNGLTDGNYVNRNLVLEANAFWSIGQEYDPGGINGDFFDGKIQEIEIYLSNQSANRKNIETNMNSYYDIYTSDADGFVTTWYDQSGNGYNATQTTAANQPQIVSSGSVILQNSKASILFNGSGQFIQSPYFGGSTNDQYFITETTDNSFLYPRGVTSYGFVATSGSSDTNLYGGYGSPTLFANNVEQSISTRGDVYNSSIGNKIITHQGTDLSSGWSYVRFGIFQPSPSALDFGGKLQEWITWNSSQSSNRSNIINNMNNFYSIY